MTAKHLLLRVVLCASWLLVYSAPLAAQNQNAAPADDISPPVEAAIKTRQTTQEAEETWRQEKEKLLASLDQLQSERAQLEESRAQLLKAIDAAQTRLATKRKQLADIEEISCQIRPFVEEQVAALAANLVQSPPFLKAERQQRITALTTLMTDPEVGISETFRKAMETLFIEAEYGFTTEVYRETITVNDQPLLADIFRLGRLGLFYQSLDRTLCGFYNIATSTWQPLPEGHNHNLSTAIEIAAKRRPVELLRLPLGRMAIQ